MKLSSKRTLAAALLGGRVAGRQCVGGLRWKGSGFTSRNVLLEPATGTSQKRRQARLDRRGDVGIRSLALAPTTVVSHRPVQLLFEAR